MLEIAGVAVVVVVVAVAVAVAVAAAAAAATTTTVAAAAAVVVTVAYFEFLEDCGLIVVFCVSVNRDVSLLFAVYVATIELVAGVSSSCIS